ncbi:MAG: hypothetical protein V4608_10955 [Bacteroidota bacterium]
MAYITNEAGEIKVIDKNGKTKYLSKVVAENAKVMKNVGLTIMVAPESFEPVYEAVEQFQETVEGAKLASETEAKAPVKKSVTKKK